MKARFDESRMVIIIELSNGATEEVDYAHATTASLSLHQAIYDLGVAKRRDGMKNPKNPERRNG